MGIFGSSGTYVQPADYGPEKQSMRNMRSFAEQFVEDQIKLVADLDAQIGDTVKNTLGISMDTMESLWQGGADMMQDFQTNWKPIQDAYVGQVNALQMQGEHDRKAAQAGQDVAQGYDSAHEQWQRQLRAQGIDPSKDSGAMANNLNMMMEKNAAISGAQTLERDRAKMMALDTARDATGMGQEINQRGMQNQALASDVGNAAATTAMNAGNTRAYLANTRLNPLSAVQGVNTDIANIKGTEYAEEMGSQKHKEATKSGGLVGTAMDMGMNIAGDWVGNKVNPAAEGGHVQAPGTTTSDSGLLRLSDGEYVLPASLVNNLGAGMLDKFVEKHTGTSPSKKQALPVGGM